MGIRAKLAANVVQLRQQAGMSQEELGFESDLHRTYVSGIERGVRNPTVDVLVRLAKALKVTPGHLLDRQPDRFRRRK